ncbi:MAG: amidophosphoribosyltransferase, partial [Chromatiales bacterium]|nr:amidophosphoribosyltransferase [Chromatiales bacterium]
ARDAGAKQVYFASAAPPVRYPNVYGIDMPSSKELIAHGRDEDEINSEIGSDKLFFQDLKDLIQSVVHKNVPDVEQFEASVFNGEYVTGDVDAEYLERIEALRNDSAKSDSEQPKSVIDMHNESA